VGPLVLYTAMVLTEKYSSPPCLKFRKYWKIILQVMLLHYHF